MQSFEVLHFPKTNSVVYLAFALRFVWQLGMRHDSMGHVRPKGRTHMFDLQKLPRLWQNCKSQAI